MKGTEKSRPAGGTAGAGRNENAAFGEAAFSSSDCITVNEKGQAQRIYDLLPHGRGQAITGQRLMEITGAGDLRSISKAVETIRRSGQPVCATTGKKPGYFRPETEKELLAYLRSFDRRLHEMRRTRDALEAAKISMAGQTVIGGWSDG